VFNKRKRITREIDAMIAKRSVVVGTLTITTMGNSDIRNYLHSKLNNLDAAIILKIKELEE
jgi:hypothetical protein